MKATQNFETGMRVQTTHNNAAGTVTNVQCVAKRRQLVTMINVAFDSGHYGTFEPQALMVEPQTQPTYEVREQTSTTNPADRGTLIRTVLTFAEARQVQTAAWAAGRDAFISKVETR